MKQLHLAAFGIPLSEATYIQPRIEGKNRTLNTFIQIALIAGLLYVIYRVNRNSNAQIDMPKNSENNDSDES
jgi:hypothetical protein